MRNIELPIHQETQRNEIKDDGGRDQPVAKPDTRQALSTTVIFSDCLQRDAPPEISVNLNVPFIPSAIGGITPAFFIEQLEDRAQQVMTISALFAPENPPAQTACNTPPIGQTFVRSNHASRCALEMQPREITRPPSHERLGESQQHHKQPCVH